MSLLVEYKSASIRPIHVSSYKNITKVHVCHWHLIIENISCIHISGSDVIHLTASLHLKINESFPAFCVIAIELLMQDLPNEFPSK